MSNCIFCSIIEGRLPAFVVYEDESFLAIMDKFPSAKGHVLLLPKRHVADIYGLNATEAAALVPLAQRISEKMRDVLGMDGHNLIQNNGKAAGQVVMHFHLHLVPRYVGDGVVIKGDGGVDASDEVLEELAGLLRL